MTKLILLGIITALLGACSVNPYRTENAIRSQCRMEMEAARTAVQLRDQGKRKREMLQTLPPLQKNSSRLLRQLYQIVDETYAYKHINSIVYGMYRYLDCERTLHHQAVPAHFAAAYPRLMACQTRFHRQISKQAVACVRGVFEHSHDKRKKK